MAKVAPAHLDSIFSAADYDGLSWLSSMICATDAFQAEHPTYGLPQPLFTLVEGLHLFAQGVRSGVFTYFEATPAERQQAMLRALQEESAPEGFAEHYRAGVEAWRDPTQSAVLDRWIDRNDELNTGFLWGLARANRAEIEAFIV
jgi:hypothetical protein